MMLHTDKNDPWEGGREKNRYQHCSLRNKTLSVIKYITVFRFQVSGFRFIQPAIFQDDYRLCAAVCGCFNFTEMIIQPLILNGRCTVTLVASFSLPVGNGVGENDHHHHYQMVFSLT